MTTGSNTKTNYYAFGMPMPEKNYTSTNYRYGMNGQEKDLEIFEGAMTAEYWEYDPRVVMRWNQDPKQIIGVSPYAINGNNPIYYTDPNGDFRTKFGANVYKFFHGGEVGKDDKGQYYVNKSSIENGEVVIKPWVYDSKVSSVAEYGRGAFGAIKNFAKFALGGGGNQTYKDGSFEADEMANSPGVENGFKALREQLAQGKTSAKFDFAFSPNPKTVLDKTLETGNPLNGFSDENKKAHIDAFKDQSWTKLYVGGYADAKITLIDANTVKITIENKTTANSFLLHGGELIFGKENGAKTFNEFFNKTPYLNTLNQRFEFTVPFKK